jgi:hypothetical protein
VATVSAAYTSSNTITITLASTTNTTIQTSSAIDNSTNLFLEARVQLKWKTGASGTSATGFVNVYLIGSPDGGTTYDDNNKTLLGTMAVVANATVYTDSWSTAPLGTLPKFWKVAVENQGGGASDTTGGNFLCQFEGIKYTVA